MIIRKPRAADQSYIAATWSRSMLSTHAHQRHLSSRTGIQVGKQIDAVLDRADTRALVACMDDDQNVITGWLLHCDGPKVPVVHYLYVRSRLPDGTPLRGRGISTALLRSIGVTRESAVVCTSGGPSGTTMRGLYKASIYMPLEEFLRP